MVASLPADKCSGHVVTTKSLFSLLRTTHILCATLQRKGATQLEKATVEGVLILSYSDTMETLYDGVGGQAGG